MPYININFDCNVFLDLAELTSFIGYCRYGFYDGNLIDSANAISAGQCYEKCKTFPNNECVAFTYSPGDPIECDVYRGGPYTYGNSSPGSTCYLMPQIGRFCLVLCSYKSILFHNNIAYYSFAV